MNRITNQVKLFVDMDGVLAKWNSNASLEETYMPGYFLAREPEQKLIDCIKLYKKVFGDVCILSATYGKRQQLEKLIWLRIHFKEFNILEPGFNSCLRNDIEVAFCPYGVSKKAYLEANYPNLLCDTNVLLDDFSKNLREWEWQTNPGTSFYGVKFLNGINGTKGTWQGAKLSGAMSMSDLFMTLKGFSDYFVNHDSAKEFAG